MVVLTSPVKCIFPTLQVCPIWLVALFQQGSHNLTNLAAKGIFGVRVPLQFFFSFRLNKNNPGDFFTDQ